MMKLDEHTRRALQARDGPPPGAQARNLAALEARLGGGGDGGEPADGGPDPTGGELASGGQAVWAAKVVGATLGLTAAGLLVLGAGGATYKRLSGDDEAVVAASAPNSAPDASTPTPTPANELARASPEPAQAAVDIKEVTSPGGLTAWLVEEHQIPFVALEIRFKGGASLDAQSFLAIGQAAQG